MPRPSSAPPPPAVLYTSGQVCRGFGELQVGWPSITTSGMPTARSATPTASDEIATGRQGNIFLSLFSGCGAGVTSVDGGGGAGGGGCGGVTSGAGLVSALGGSGLAGVSGLAAPGPGEVPSPS